MDDDLLVYLINKLNLKSMKKLLLLLAFLPVFVFGQSNRFKKEHYGYRGNEYSYNNYYRHRSPRIYYDVPSDFNRSYRRNKYSYYRPYLIYGDWRIREQRIELENCYEY